MDLFIRESTHIHQFNLFIRKRKLSINLTLFTREWTHNLVKLRLTLD